MATEGVTQSHKMLGPKAGTQGDTIVRAIHEHGPMTRQQLAEIHSVSLISVDARSKAILRCVGWGWIEEHAGVFDLTTAMREMLDKAHENEPPKYVGEIVKPAYHPPFAEIKRHNIPSTEARRNDAQPAREMSVKTGSCGAASIYWRNGL